MRRFLFFILIGFILLACSEERKTYTLLSEIESYIESEPKRALLDLEEIKNDIGTSQKVKAKHALLYSMACPLPYKSDGL